MRAVVFYATREGQTRRIAEHIASGLRAHHVEVDLHDVRTPPPSIDWSRYDWACVAASVHAGHHEPEMIAFVKAPSAGTGAAARRRSCPSPCPRPAPKMSGRRKSDANGRPPTRNR